MGIVKNKLMINLNSSFDKNASAALHGFTKACEEVVIRKIKNRTGMELVVSDFGATITSLQVPNGDGEVTDVVLGFDTAEAYEASFSLSSPPYLGAVVGLNAGRIKHGRFYHQGKTTQLDCNSGKHHLHGGFKNLSNQVWKCIREVSGDKPSVTYAIETTPEGFSACSVTVEVCYTLLENNTLQVTFSANANQEIPVNLTHHAYFNLNGHDKAVTGLQLKIQANNILETDAELIPTGGFVQVRDSAYDFNLFKNCPETIDTTFVLKSSKACVLYSPITKIKLEVSTNQPGVHVYVGGNCFNKIKGKNNASYHPLSGICFETQNFPDAPNHANFPNPFLPKGKNYFSVTQFQFSVTDKP